MCTKGREPDQAMSPGLEQVRRVSPDAALQALLTGTGAAVGPEFFRALVRQVAEVFRVTSAVVGERKPGQDTLHPLAVWSQGDFREEQPLALTGTAFEQVLTQGVFHCQEAVDTHFSEDGWLRRLGPGGFLGMALRSSRGEVLGALALLHDAPLEVGPPDLALLGAFASRLVAELERLQAQAGMEQARDFLRKVLNSIQDPLFVKDRAHRWIVANDAFCRFMNHPEAELLGKSDYDFVPSHEADVFWRQDELVFGSGQPNENEESITDSAGLTHTLVTKKAVFTGADGQPYLVAVIRDITEYTRLETQLRLADRMVAVGTMASGIAHEINNPMAYVSANLSFLREQLSQEDVTELDLVELREVVAEAIEGAGRVRSIVEDLKGFTRSDEKRLGPVELPQVIDSAQRLVRHQLQTRARLVHALEPVPPVFGNAARLGQVLVNLLVNAVQSFSVRDPERNLIRISSRTNGAAQVVVEVEDNGRGMEPEVLKRLFSPFFTTKPVGEGTGLGLAISHAIIESMGGQIEVRSTPGRGSTFRLVLPVFSEGVPPVGQGA
ncbi:PAS domain-containing protein [Archangium minus]|uniref:histidine kinase n=1 Tax=Archangium minus TaxID=83450 RepID=A0ABY9WRT4_9BACT|nr:PAS domain-containing protein [Archangium minus]